MTTILGIQARCGSSRFPNKVLADLNGRPMLAHVLHRALNAALVDEVMVLTTDTPNDDAITALCEAQGVRCLRGPVDDVLTRYVRAAAVTGAKLIVRITADCPLLDGTIVDAVIESMLADGAEYASNVLPPTYPDGYDVEVMTEACLRRLDHSALRPYEREHVTAYLREHADEFRVANVHSDVDLSAHRLTVDTPDDLRRVRGILNVAGDTAGLTAVMGALSAHPHLATLAPATVRDAAYHAQRMAARSESSR